MVSPMESTRVTPVARLADMLQTGDPLRQNAFGTAQSLLFRERDYVVRWMLTAGCGGLAGVWLWLSGIGFDFQSLLPKLQFAGFLLVCVGLYAAVGTRVPRLARSAAVANDLLLSVVQFLALMSAFLPLSYAAATTGFPLLDDVLMRIDAAWFGFHWDSAAAWVEARPWLTAALHIAYGSIFWQGTIVLIVGSLRRTGERNGESLWLFAVSLAVTIAVFCVTPALGTTAGVGAGPMTVLQALRDGHVAIFSYSGAEGIITFPSFHTALAIILTYCVRRDRYLLAVSAPLNAVMLVSIPLVGGHYLVDMVGGAVVAAISIVTVRRLRGEAVPVQAQQIAQPILLGR